MVADLTRGQEFEGQGLAQWTNPENADRSAMDAGDGMKSGVQATFRPADQASTPPCFTRRLEAVRCVFRQVTSIMIVSGRSSAAESPSVMRARAAMSLHRFQRL